LADKTLNHAQNARGACTMAEMPASTTERRSPDRRVDGRADLCGGAHFRSPRRIIAPGRRQTRAAILLSSQAPAV